MNEFAPQNKRELPLNPEQKRALVKECGERAITMFTKGGPTNRGPYNKVLAFAEKFREKHPNASNFLLFHDLVLSSTIPELEPSMSLDTTDGEIERFVTQELLPALEKVGPKNSS